MSGLELAERLAELRPDLPVILTTGYSDEIAKSGAGGRAVILKPYRLETLAAAIDQALRRRLSGTAYAACQPSLGEGWSGRQDSNLRPSAPKADALPGCATPRLRSCGASAGKPAKAWSL